MVCRAQAGAAQIALPTVPRVRVRRKRRTRGAVDNAPSAASLLVGLKLFLQATS